MRQEAHGRLVESALHYQSVLAAQPANLPALIGMSVVAQAGGQPEAAVQMAAAAVAAVPDSLHARIALGQALIAASHFDEAERVYAHALRIDAASPLLLLAIGELKVVTHRAGEAVADFKRALAHRPAWAAAHLGLGNALARLGRHADALASYERAAELAPRSAEAHFAAGFALAQLMRNNEAEARYRRALFLRPDFAAAWLNLGVLLREQGRDLAAQSALERAVQLRPQLISAWLNLALLERERGKMPEAEKHLHRALGLDPANREILMANCQLCAAQRDQAGAWAWLRRAQALDAGPDAAAEAQGEIHNMEGILLHQEGRFEEAIAAFAQAEELGHRAAASNRGNSLLELNRADQALAAHRHAVNLDPQSSGSRYNLALTELRLGAWKTGWVNYEARWSFREVHRKPRVFAQPRWRGEPLRGRRILLHAEQGLGDTIQFCRYAAMVAARGGFPLLAVQEPALRLVQSLAVVRAGAAQVVPLDAALKPSVAFDCECPLLSLPAIFGTTTQTVPWTGAYLGAGAAEAASKYRQFPGLAGVPRIGMAWAGNPRYRSDAQRSMPLSNLVPLLRNMDADWISLQKGDAAAQIADLPDDVRLRDGSSGDCDLAETAALMASLDLVMTTDTSIAHLAGALGKPVWILLPHHADWRWMQETEHTPWYPTARLFRQRARGDWQSVFDQVMEESGGLIWSGLSAKSRYDSR